MIDNIVVICVTLTPTLWMAPEHTKKEEKSTHTEINDNLPQSTNSPYIPGRPNSAEESADNTSPGCQGRWCQQADVGWFHAAPLNYWHESTANFHGCHVTQRLSSDHFLPQCPAESHGMLLLCVGACDLSRNLKFPNWAEVGLQSARKKKSKLYINE